MTPQAVPGCPSFPGDSAHASTAYTSTNRLTGFGYDAAGNLTSYPPYTLAYDAENRLTSVTSASNGAAIYQYDGEGRRVRKLVCLVLADCQAVVPPSSVKVTTFVYDPEGEMAQEITTATVTETGTRYLTTDHLGSTRLETDGTGAMTKCLDYAPFGESLAGNYGRTAACFTATANAPMFTGKYRDQETLIDYFEARFYSAAQGRFLSPDAPLADQNPSDPQSWNLYTYARNNPLSNVDPTGQGCKKTVNSNGSVDYVDNGEDGPDCMTVLAGNGKPQELNVGMMSGDEARLYSLFIVGRNLTDSHQQAELVSGGILSAGAVLAPTASTLAECATASALGGTCDKTGVGMAVVHVPKVPLGLQPFVRNKKLRNILNAFNRTGGGIGTGSTADAIRHEISTGALVGGKAHFEKGEGFRNGLIRLLRDPSLDASDRQIVKELLVDLQDALSTPRR